MKLTLNEIKIMNILGLNPCYERDINYFISEYRETEETREQDE